jgi:phosphonate transport system permease protein
MNRSELRQSFLSNRERIEAENAGAFATRRQIALPLAIIGGALGLYIFGLIALDISPVVIVRGASRLFDIIKLMVPPNPETWSRFLLYLAALGQTLSIAFIGTLLAAILAVPFAFLAAKNVVPSQVLHLLTRRSLDSIRSVDTLIWALIWIGVVGMGPFAGVLAIMSSDFGAFGKLMSEAIETADRRATDAVIASGGRRLHAIRFGIVPQVLPVIASQVLYFFESNVRSATIIGIVGAGGIGLHLFEEIQVLEWRHASCLILMVLITVAAIDFVSQRLRSAIIGARPI